MLVEKNESEQTCHDPNWHIHVKNPTPRQLGYKQAPKYRADCRCEYRRKNEDTRDLHALRWGERTIQHSCAHWSERSTGGSLQDSE